MTGEQANLVQGVVWASFFAACAFAAIGIISNRKVHEPGGPERHHVWPWPAHATSVVVGFVFGLYHPAVDRLLLGIFALWFVGGLTMWYLDAKCNREWR